MWSRYAPLHARTARDMPTTYFTFYRNPDGHVQIPRNEFHSRKCRAEAVQDAWKCQMKPDVL